MDRIRGLKWQVEKIRNEKKRETLLNWLPDVARYLSWVETFNPTTLPKFSRGDIVDVNFGWNPGNELVGRHFAVVVSNDPKKSGTIMVIPLTSLKYDIDKIYNENIDLGELNLTEEGVTSIARVNQMRAISKMRIYKGGGAIKGKINNNLLDKIDAKIIELFTK